MNTNLFFLNLFLFFGYIADASVFDEMKNAWSKFKVEYSKDYKDNNTTEEIRFKIFRKNFMDIWRHNKRYDRGLVSFTMGINEFSDMLADEISATMTGFEEESLQELSKYSDFNIHVTQPNDYIPDEIDWRRLGAVTPVKSQGKCGSCWAFGSIGSLEGQHFRRTGNLTSLSEQNLIDCSSGFGNHGCKGGKSVQSYQYVIINGGIDTEEGYPYEMRVGKCRYSVKNQGTTAYGYVKVRSGNEESLKEAVATVGPVAAAIDGRHQSFHMYKNGIYYEKECLISNMTTHLVLVVGYGTEYIRHKAHDYWLVKNSWGTSWGINGYIKMARNRNNNCLIARRAIYPLV